MGITSVIETRAERKNDQDWSDYERAEKAREEHAERVEQIIEEMKLGRHFDRVSEYLSVDHKALMMLDLAIKALLQGDEDARAMAISALEEPMREAAEWMASE